MTRHIKNCKLLAFILLVCALGFNESVFGATHYIDYTGGSDSNDGVSTATPWQHLPGDVCSGGNATGYKSAPGDIFIFKKGVTYLVCTNNGSNGLMPKNSGALIVSATNAQSISSTGVLSDTNVSFTISNAAPGDFLYVYHNLADGVDVESVGWWTITNVAATALTVEDFNALGYTNTGLGGLSYIVVRPIIYTSTNTWGTGDAFISGGKSVHALFRASQSYLLWRGLVMGDMQDITSDGCTATSQGVIWDNSGTTKGIFVDSCTFTNFDNGVFFVAETGGWEVVQNCLFTNSTYCAANGGAYSLIQSNVCKYLGHGFRGCDKYSVIRYNQILHCFKPSTNICGRHSDALGPFFSAASAPNSNVYGWIYDNVIVDNIQGIFLEYNNQGTRGWTIANNVLLGEMDTDGAGAAGIMISGAPDTKIYNNILIGPNNQRGWISAVNIGSKDDQAGIVSSNVVFKNNILFDSGTNSMGMMKLYSQCANTFVSEGNYFYEPQVGSSTPFNIGYTNGSADSTYIFSRWQGLGFDSAGYSTHNIDPQFTAVGGTEIDNFNLHLRPQSPACASLFHLAISLRDASGVLRSGNSRWDRGAYQTSAVVAPPSNLRVH